uniref:Uncharacterized protein n=1 Tax=Salix viminalis TaxID=40686 RepID=A0A6N2LGD7_SALVM
MITSPFHILFLSSELNCRRLLQILKTVNFELHVHEPFFTQLEDGLKTIEGNCAVEWHQEQQSFSISVLLQVQVMMISFKLPMLSLCDLPLLSRIHRHASFLETMQAEGLEKVLPERLEFTAQPYISLARILPASHRAS